METQKKHFDQVRKYSSITPKTMLWIHATAHLIHGKKSAYYYKDEAGHTIKVVLS